MSGRRWRSEKGLLTTELILIAPIALFGFVSLVMLAGRTADTRIGIQSATHRAARAATLSASAGAAQTEAARVADENLVTLSVGCLAPGPVVSTAIVDAAGSPAAFAPGSYVEVTVRCTVDLSDLASVSMPGSVTIERSALELIDKYRGG